MPGSQQKPGLLARRPVAEPLLSSPGTVKVSFSPAKLGAGLAGALPCLHRGLRGVGWPAHEKIKRRLFYLRLTGSVSTPTSASLSASLGLS